jgi:hypothetical protein
VSRGTDTQIFAPGFTCYRKTRSQCVTRSRSCSRSVLAKQLIRINATLSGLCIARSEIGTALVSSRVRLTSCVLLGTLAVSLPV